MTSQHEKTELVSGSAQETWLELVADPSVTAPAAQAAGQESGLSTPDNQRDGAAPAGGQREGRTVNRSEYEAEILAAAGRLDPADTSGMAGLLREMAVSIRDHQAMAARRAEWAAQDARDAAEVVAVAEADSAESPAAAAACGVGESSVPLREGPAPVVAIGPRSAEQVGYGLAWQAGLGRAEDWRRSSGLPRREVALLTVGEDRPAARPGVAAAERAAVDGVMAGTGVEAKDWSAGSCQEASLQRLADPAVSAADEDERWPSYEDSRRVDDGMVDE